MAITFNLWVLLFGSGLVIGVFLQFLFLSSAKRHSIHFRNISAALFVMTLLLLDEFMQESDLIDYYPFFLEITLVADLLIWPFLLFYFQAVFGNRNSYGIEDLFLFVPFVIGLFWQWSYLVSSGPEKVAYFQSTLPKSFEYFVAFKALTSFVFLAITLSVLHPRTRSLGKPVPSRQKQFLRHYQRAIWSVLVIMALMYGSFFLRQTGISPGFPSDKIGSLLIMSTFYLLGILAFNTAKLDQPSYSAYIITSLQKQEASYIDQLLSYFDTEKPYLQDELSIKATAQRLDLSTQQLSYLLNQQVGVSFQDFVNGYRVAYFKQAIEQEEHHSKTLLGIALESGFKSKATFNRAFKNSEGVSPSVFVKKTREKVSNSN